MTKLINEDLYKEIVKSMPIPTVDVLIFNKSLNKTLLFKRNNAPAKGEYYSLGGRIHKGESLLACAKRKIEEEVGLDTKNMKLVQIGVINDYFPNSFFDDKVSSHYLNIYYAMIIEDHKTLQLDNQHSEYQWFDVHDKTLVNPVKERILNSLKTLKNNG